MKKCKKAIVNQEKYEVIRYLVQCPHCKTILVGGYNENTIRMLCSHCRNPIELVFE